DDSILQTWANEYARYFWYGIVTVIGLAAFHNLLWRMNLELRYSTPPSAGELPRQADVNVDGPQAPSSCRTSLKTGCSSNSGATRGHFHGDISKAVISSNNPC